MLRFLAMAAGLALLPPLSHAQSGVVFPGGNTMGFTIQGTEQVRVTADGRVGVSTTSPHASAVLDISTTSKGVLLPRLTTTQRMALANPAEGLMVYDTGYNVLAVYAQGAWRNIGGGTSSQMTDFTKGFFVFLASGFNSGNLGGMSGANTICYNQLNNANWVGKSESIFAHPDLDTSSKQSRVRAFLCDNTGCQNPVASTAYYAASASSTSIGGALLFTSDGSGNAPGNTTAWTGSQFYLQPSCDGEGYCNSTYLITGRNTGSNSNFVTTANTNRCNNWSNGSSSYNASAGTMGSTNTARWSGVTQRCDRIQTAPMSSWYAGIMCMVHPL